jgi:hypothetical protein
LRVEGDEEELEEGWDAIDYIIFLVWNGMTIFHIPVGYLP